MWLFLFVRNDHIFVKMKAKYSIGLSFVLLVFFSCQNNTKQPETAEIKRDNDTVAVVDIQKIDTSEMESFSVDSLKMCAAFQTAANEFTTGYKLKNVAIYAKYLHPSIVSMNGGIEKFKQKLVSYVKQDTAQYRKMVTGPVKRVEAAIDPKGNVTGWYCLMPVQRWPLYGNKKEIKVQWLAGQSLDHGQHIYFIDITGIPKENIYRIMPNFHFLLDKEFNR